MNTSTQSLLGFSPLAPVFLKTLGLTDKNGNGTIDKGAGEGYEQFVAKYGNVDIGYKNDFCIIQGTNDGKLTEKEIVDYYYLNIRFAFPEETKKIDEGLEAEIRRSGIYTAWLDDDQGTLRQKFKIPATQDAYAEIKKIFLDLKPRWFLDTNQAGYITLPGAVQSNGFSCYEATLFGFWFSSQLHVRTLPMHYYAEFGDSTIVSHLILGFPETGKTLDVTPYSYYETVPGSAKIYENPVQMLGDYYTTLAYTKQNKDTLRETTLLETAMQYQKDDNAMIVRLMSDYVWPADASAPRYQDAIVLGEVVLSRVDFKSLGNMYPPRLSKELLSNTLCILMKSYVALGNQQKFTEMATLAKTYFADTEVVQRYSRIYGFSLK